ncbi:MAG: FIST C-terminal domain-containing protein [Clostridiales Family XIII bacterium]|jgi:hypothetical protein|nr:FIST C-terminal domain-containing protein [Clostridiales Family XIII bacterium]
MIKLITASTSEIDDVAAAVEEIRSQIDLEGGLSAHSVGIVACYYEFVETGVARALCEILPFDVIGCTVLGSAINGRYGLEQLSLSILTSDDVRFATAFSETIAKEDVDAPLARAYAEARGKLQGDPSFILAFAPIMTDVSGDNMLRRLDAVGGGVPVFGTLSNDTSLTYEHSMVFRNGEADRNKAALLLFEGAINPRFFTTAISEKNIQQQTAVVTDAEGSLLKSVDNIPCLEYLASLGVETNGLAAVTTLPFLIDYGDGTKPIAFSMYAFTEEGIFCGGNIPVGAKIAMADVDYNSVMETAQTTVSQALADVEAKGGAFMLAIPCFTRGLVISPNSEEEMKRTSEMIGDTLPFMLLYSGGEMCPVYDEKGGAVNRFHNLTYTLVVF